MFKQIIARFLIFLQIYGILFQGALHANFADHHLIDKEIYFYGSVGKHGELLIALGTNDSLQKDGLNSPKMLKIIEIPDFKTLKTQNRQSPKPLQRIKSHSDTALESDFGLQSLLQNP